MIAVTGANGLIGSFIIRKLIEKSEVFVALKRRGSDTSLLADVAEKITWRDADVLDPVAMDEALADVTHVIHAAGYVSNNTRETKKILNINQVGTRNVVNTCLHHGIKRLLHVSSVAALGRQQNQPLIDENNLWVDSPLNNVYGKSKYLAELEVFRGLTEGLSTVMINPSVVLAPADWERSSARLFKYAWQQRPFYTTGYLNYVDVRDVAEITYRLLNGPYEGERFILNAGNISIKEILHKIAKQFGRKVPTIALGKNFLQVYARFESIRAAIFGKEPMVTRETARWAGTRFLFQNTKIVKTLSYNFLPIDDSIAWCCQYYKNKLEALNTRGLYGRLAPDTIALEQASLKKN